jgi:ribosomal protein L30E
MTIPARFLAARIMENAVLPVRTADGKPRGTITYAQIKARIKAGTITGIGSKKTIRFVILEDEKQVMKDESAEEREKTTSITTAASVTVYREPVRDENGNVFARVWNHKACRAL